MNVKKQSNVHCALSSKHDALWVSEIIQITAKNTLCYKHMIKYN